MYIILHDNIIQGVYGSSKLPQNAIEVPNTFNGHKGENINLFNKDFSRKTLEQLVDEKLATIPQGKKIFNNQFVDLSQAEKIKAGLEEIPKGKKLVDNELVEMSVQEKLENILIKKTDKEYIDFRISELESYLSSTDWFAIRKADSGKEIPEDISKARENARKEISRLKK